MTQTTPNPVRLEEWDLAEIQGNILNAYPFPAADYLLLGFPTAAAARDGIAALLPKVRFAERWQPNSRPDRAVNIAVTFSGLRRLGVAERLLAGLPDAFRQGPAARAQDLGDIGSSAPEQWEAGIGTGDVHVLVSVHATDEKVLDAESAAVRAAIRSSRPVEIAAHRAHLLCKKREHFGYADGAAQPFVEGAPRSRDAATPEGGGVPLPDGRWRPVRLGEFLLGYPDEDGEVSLSPAPGLVRNGSYLVYRKLYQDVGRFREGLADAARRSGLPVELVAAKVVGRWRDGEPLEHAPDRQVATDLTDEMQPPRNDFRYLPHDRDGAHCPRGAHIRRANPRDALDFGGRVEDSGRLTARHRIIRRGMPYGPELPVGSPDDGKDRGLLFLCFNADIGRQYETIQAEWCNDGDAFGLGADRDYLLGAAGGSGKMTIPVRGSSPRFIPSLADVVVTCGAEYLFAPSRSALCALASGTFAG